MPSGGHQDHEKAVIRAENFANKLEVGKEYGINDLRRLWKFKNTNITSNWVRRLQVYGVLGYEKFKRKKKVFYTFYQ